MRTRLYLDTRSRPVTPEGEEPRYPVKISISVRQRTAYLNTGVRLPESEWSSGGWPRKAAVRIALEGKRLAVERVLEELRTEGRLHGLSAVEIKDLAADRLKEQEEGRRNSEATVLDCFERYASTRDKDGTAGVYRSTVRRLLAYPGFKRNFTFQDITPLWLSDFEDFLSRTAPSANARAIHLRNIRAVFNDALETGRTRAAYSFKRFKIATAPTPDRSLSPEEVRALVAAPKSEAQKRYLDLFVLSVLCCGIGPKDLLSLKGLKGGRIETLRSKTGQPLSIGVLPEADAIMRRLKGEKHLLYPLDHASYGNFLRRMDKALKTIGMTYNPSLRKWEGEPLQPGLSFYWARFTWATAAAELDIPERTIGAALGHSTSKSVTSIYMRVDMRRKTDAANKAVKDYIFGKSLEIPK